MKRRLLEALARDEFVLHLQAIVDAKTHKTVGYEALTRWQRGEEGIVYPGHFIHEVIKHGVGRNFDINTLVRTVEIIKAHDFDKPVNVNVNADLLLHERSYESFYTLLRSFEVSPEQLRIEITEIQEIRDYDLLARHLSDIRKLGCEIVVDDFGEGFNSFRMLYHLPIDEVKLDRAYIQSPKVHDKQGMLASLVNMLHQNGILVTAEGAETKEQVDLLTAAGMDKIQGFYFHKPEPVNSNNFPNVRNTSLDLDEMIG